MYTPNRVELRAETAPDPHTPILSHFLRLCFECKIFLGQITEGNHNDGGNDFRNGGIEMKMFHKKADENIVEHNTNQNQQEIAEQLDPAV